MEIEQRGGNELVITGNIKSIEDGMEIKEAIKVFQKNGAKTIILRIRDSFSMTSTVIGFLMKLVNLDKIKISMIVGDQRLYRLLEDLSLIHPFNVRIVEK